MNEPDEPTPGWASRATGQDDDAETVERVRCAGGCGERAPKALMNVAGGRFFCASCVPVPSEPHHPAIRTVLAAYRSTEGHVTEEQITAAWAEYDALAAVDQAVAERDRVVAEAEKLRDAQKATAESLFAKAASEDRAADRSAGEGYTAANAAANAYRDAARAVLDGLAEGENNA